MRHPMSTPGAATRQPAKRPSDVYRRLYQAERAERIGLIKAGVKASDAKTWLDFPSIGTLSLLKALDLPAATFNRKVKTDARLSKAESERVLGFARLVGHLEALIQEAGEPADFDTRVWMSRWLTEPLPALGNVRPIDMMDTMDGQNLVSQKLDQVVSGAYA